MSYEIIAAVAEEYAAKHTTPESSLLQSIVSETYAYHAQPHMLSGHVQGRFLSLISKLIRPNYILEIGTFTGYSALCMAEGLSNVGQLHTIEVREEDANISQQNFDRSEYGSKIILHRGNAKEIIPTLPLLWDLVFIDADKSQYVDYYELVMLKLSPGALIIADNVLFHGQVLANVVTGKNALAIERFNNHILGDPRVEQVLLTVRDGLLLIKTK